MAAASSEVELCTLANAKLDAATSAKFFHDDDGAGAMSCSFSWPEAERTPSRFTNQIALLPLCTKYQVPADYKPISLDSSWVACRPPPEGSNAVCVYVDALEAGMRIPLHDFYVAVLGHYGLAPSQLAPDAWRYMAAFMLLCKDAGVEPTLPAFLSFFSICTHKGDSMGWHHFSSRLYFKSRSGVTTGIFTAGNKMPRSDGWKSRFFHLQSPSSMPWPCPVKWGKPSRAAVRLPEVRWDDTVVKKLLERAGGSAIDVMEFLSGRSLPVAAATQDAPRDRGRVAFTLQQKHKVIKVGAAAGSPASAPPQQQELSRKRKSFSEDTHTRGLVDCIAESSELAKKAMTELDEKRKELNKAMTELGEERKELNKAMTELDEERKELNKAMTELDEQRKEVKKAKTELDEKRKELKKAMTELDEERKELKATRGEIAHLKEEVRAVRDKHAADVAQLEEALSVANARHTAEVRRLADEHAATAVAQTTERLNKEHATAVAQIIQRLNKEHTAAGTRLKEKHADDVARLNKEHAAAVTRLKEKHADGVARLNKEHARVKDAADKELQDTKKKVVLRLFPSLDVSLLERTKLKGDLTAAGIKQDPDKTAD